MEEELNASSFASVAMRADIRYIDIRETKIRTAKGFGSTHWPAERGRKFCSRNDHCGIQFDRRPIEILANLTLLPLIQHTNRASHSNFFYVKLHFFLSYQRGTGPPN